MIRATEVVVKLETARQAVSVREFFTAVSCVCQIECNNHARN